MNNLFSHFRFSAILSTVLIFSFFTLTGCGGGNSNGIYNPRNPFGEGPAAVSLSTTGSTDVPGDMGSAGSYVILASCLIVSNNVPFELQLCPGATIRTGAFSFKLLVIFISRSVPRAVLI